jgi:type IV secretory pathway TrbD component
MKEITNAIAAAQVLSFRLPMLWAMALSPTPARRAEAMKMIVEKQMAVMEGMNAAALSALATWMKAAGGQTMSAQAASQEVMQAALQPGQRRVRANARRLKRRKRL